MAMKCLPLYNVTVKNTFIETAEDDELSGEEDIRSPCHGVFRQMSAPATPTCIDLKMESRLNKFFVPNSEAFDDSTTDSNDTADNNDDPSDDSSSAGHGHPPGNLEVPETIETSKQNVESKKAQEWSGSQGWSYSEQYWPAWNDKDHAAAQQQWMYCHPGQQQAPGQWFVYGMEPNSWDNTYAMDSSCYPSMKLAANALAAAADTRGPLHYAQKPENNKDRLALKRNKRESLIDLAAKQQQENVAEKKKNQEPSTETVKGANKPSASATKFCSNCGGSFQSQGKFCPFCGTAVPSTAS